MTDEVRGIFIYRERRGWRRILARLLRQPPMETVAYIRPVDDGEATTAIRFTPDGIVLVDAREGGDCDEKLCVLPKGHEGDHTNDSK